MLRPSAKFLAIGLTALLLAHAAAAKDYSEGSKAKKWRLTGEEKAVFSGKVVDILCELSGDCPQNCGGGLRQLGIVRADDNKLIAVLKNSQASFNGAAEDLLPYCNQAVDVDGLLVGDETRGMSKIYMVQLIRVSGEEEWNRTRLWTKAWAARNAEAKGKGPWFRRDPRVKKQLEADGYFGLGAEADQKYIEENL